MRNYASTVTFPKKHWVSATYKITDKFIVQRVSLHEIDIQSQRLVIAENVPNRASVLLSKKSFSHCAMDFRTVSMVFVSLFASQML